MKKAISLLLVCCMLLTLAPVQVFAREAVPDAAEVRADVPEGRLERREERPSAAWAREDVQARGGMEVARERVDIVTTDATHNVSMRMDTPGWGWAYAWPNVTVEGSIIQLTAFPNPGFAFVRWEILSGDVQISNPSSSGTQFIMPAHDVSIRAVFREMVNPARINLSVNNPDWGTASATPMDLAEPGTQVRLVARESPGATFLRWEVLSGNLQLDNPYLQVLGFVMPTDDVSIQAVFLEMENPRNVTMSANVPTWGSAEARPSIAEPGTLIQINAFSVTGTFFERWEVLEGEVQLEVSAWNWAHFIMPEGDVSIRAVFREIPTIYISANNPYWGQVFMWSSSTRPGESVSIEAQPNPGFAFSYWEVLSGNVQLQDPYSTWTSFTMPDHDVELRAIFHEVITSNVTVSSNNLDWGWVASLQDTAETGEWAGVDAFPNPGHLFVRWEVLEGDVEFVDPYSVWGDFIMPDHDVHIQAVFREMVNPVEISASANNPKWGWADVELSPAEPGMELWLGAWPKPGFIFDHWEVLAGDLQIHNLYSPWATVIVSEHDVSVQAVFRPLGTKGPALGMLSELFPDANLAQMVAIRLELWDWDTWQMIDHLVTQADLDSIAIIDSHDVGAFVTDLQGIHYLRNLHVVILEHGGISNLTPLAELMDLGWLSLWDNRVTDLTPLAGLSSLVALDLGNNLISDLQPLAALTDLEILWLDANRISDLRPLVGLTNLRELVLENQHITLPAALLTNPFVLEHTVFNPDGSRTSVSETDPFGVYIAPNVTWSGMPDNTRELYYFFGQTVTLGNAATWFSGTVTQPIVLHDVPLAHWGRWFVTQAHTKGFVRGNPDGSFNPYGELTRAQAAQILANMAGVGAFGALPWPTTNPFPDVPASAWYAPVIAWAAEREIMNGHADGRFAPGEPITREQFAVILWNFAAYRGVDAPFPPGGGAEWPFPDNNQISWWAVDAAEWANSHRIILGDTLGFRPGDTVSRVEAATMVVRFDDVPWAAG